MTTLNISGTTNLESLTIEETGDLKTVTLGQHKLTKAYIYNNSDLETLNLGMSNTLDKLDLDIIANAKLNSVILSSITNLDDLFFYDNDMVEDLILTSNINISSLEIEDSRNLKSITLGNHILETVDIKNSLYLETLDMGVSTTPNRLSISLTNCPLLEGSTTGPLDFSSISNLGSFNLRQNDELKSLDFTSNSNLDYLYISWSNALESIVLGNHKLEHSEIRNNDKLKTLDYGVSTTSNRLFMRLVSNKELLGKTVADPLDFSSLTNLGFIEVSLNSKLKSLDFTSNNNLSNLYIYINNDLQSVVLGNHKLAGDNEGDPSIRYNNKLTTVDMGNSNTSFRLDAYNNALTSLDVSGVTGLSHLTINDNHLTGIDLSANAALTKLVLSNNELVSLDVSNNSLLTYLSVNYQYNNPLNINNLACLKVTQAQLDMIANSTFTLLNNGNNAGVVPSTTCVP
jgi:hypothetical protein